MLKNLNMFVSPIRLCIRNIPPNIDDKKLLAIVKKFSENPTGKIIIWADVEDVEPKEDVALNWTQQIKELIH